MVLLGPEELGPVFFFLWTIRLEYGVCFIVLVVLGHGTWLINVL